MPRPYVFEPPDGTKMEYAAGEKMRFGQLTHAGKRADFGLGRYRLRET